MLFYNSRLPQDLGFPRRGDVEGGPWWNLWRNRQYPFKSLVKGTRVILVDTWREESRTISRLTWEVEVARCVKEHCRNKSEAITKIAHEFGCSRDYVRGDPYTAAKPEASYWLLAWKARPVRRIDLPRPPDLRFWPQGWLEVNDNWKLRRWGLDGSTVTVREGELVSGGGQGRRSPKEQKAVERRAVEIARRWCEKQGWRAIVEHPVGPYDLSARVPGTSKRVYVEAKGTTGETREADVTAGEVRHARENPERTYLVLVTGIRLTKGPQGPIARGGKLHVFPRWYPRDKDLRVLTYRWHAPSSAFVALRSGE